MKMNSTDMLLLLLLLLTGFFEKYRIGRVEYQRIVEELNIKIAIYFSQTQFFQTEAVMVISNTFLFEVHFDFRVVRGPFGPGVWGLFGLRSGSIRAPFGPILDQNFRSQKFKTSKSFKLCGRRRRGGGPLAAVPSPAAGRAPDAAAAAAQIESFRKRTFNKFRNWVGMY